MCYTLYDETSFDQSLCLGIAAKNTCHVFEDSLGRIDHEYCQGCDEELFY